MKWLMIERDGYTGEVSEKILVANSKEDVVNYVQEEMGEEADLCWTDDSVLGTIPCDENHMLFDTYMWCEKLDKVTLKDIRR